MIALTRFEQKGLLSMLDVELATTLARLGREQDPDVLLAIALASQAVSEGHVCLDLAQRARTPWLDDTGAAVSPWPELATWLDKLRASPLVRTENSDDARPLVLEHDHKLYLARYHDHECRVAAHVLALARAATPSPAPSAALVDALFPPRTSGAPDLQRTAALAARERRMSVIVGGPGTGKTSTVVKLLALLVYDALSQRKDAPRILLLAPTGKAAQRLSEATLRARDGLSIDEHVRANIPGEAITVHRALGSIGGSSTRFRHGPDHPLDCDVLLLDEASMVDLALMRRLLDAVPTHARVIMLGDPDQLSSVEAGGVLGDLCAAADRAGSWLGPVVSRLKESYRYAAGSGIAQLAAAVHAGDAEQAIELLRSGHADVAYHGALPATRLGRALEGEVRKHYAALSGRDLGEKLAALERYRVLSPHRKGDTGVEALNLAIARVVQSRRTRAHESYNGRPVLVTQNDYGARLFNGDVGVLHTDRRHGALSACFREGDGSVRTVALGRLPAHESVYAMTVHKSQGSEFEHVAIVLPERPSPVASRELLYTAITRAKASLSLYASERAVRAALAQRVERSSGLVARLTE